MILSLTIALAAGAAVAAAVEVHSHDVRVDHPRGTIDASYRGRTRITHRQVGAVAPGGRPSTLRCLWRADVVVDRSARHPAGSTMARSLTREAVLSGSRPGWCEGARDAIDREVAARGGAIRDHLAAVAVEDRATLIAEADRLHPGASD